jgi:lipoprotein-anchoring transpeptidase ErfK/SrfK
MASAQPAQAAPMDLLAFMRRREPETVRVNLHEQPLTIGMQGPVVQRFQQALGQFVDVPQNGVFDATTRQGLMQFQQAEKLKPTGQLDVKTYAQMWNKLFWEQGVAHDLNGAEFYRSAPVNSRLDIDLTGQRLHLVDADTGAVFKTYPISSGTAKHPTPRMRFSITNVNERPTWTPPKSDWAKNSKVTPPGPENPLGPVKLRLNGSTILIHGVPRKAWDSIGKTGESHGCMRMFPHEVWELHNLVGVNTPGVIR